MLTVFRLIFDPVSTWDAIVKKKRGVAWMLALYLVPLLLVCIGVEAWSLLHKGLMQTVVRNVPRIITDEVAIQYACMHLFGFIGMLFLASAATCWLGKSFHCEVNFESCAVVIGYSLGGLCLGRLLDAIPVLNTWIAWGVGLALALSLLYNGLPRVVRLDPTKGLGLFFLTALILSAMSGVAHFFAYMILRDPGIFK